MPEVGEILALNKEVADGFKDVAATAVWRCFELESVLVNIEEGVSGKNLMMRSISVIRPRDSGVGKKARVMLPLLEQTHSLFHKL